MQRVVKRKLPSPSTADFPGGIFSDQAGHVNREGKEAYFVHSYVDHQIATGAIIRTYYTGGIRKTPSGGWRVTDLSINL